MKTKAKEEIVSRRRPEAVKTPGFTVLPIRVRMVLREEGRK